MKPLLATLLLAAAMQAQTPVILISIDTLRADHLSAYGYKKISTPNIDAFAQGGTLFSAATTQIPITLPSHTALFTSTHPFANRIEENAEPVARPTATLASVLHTHGYKTAAFIGSVFLEKELGLDQGFDVYDSPFNFQAFSPMSGEMLFAGALRNPFSVKESRDGALVVRAAIQWTTANKAAPLFAFIHLFDLHKPYKISPTEARQRGISLYDAQLLYADQVLGRLRQSLIANGLWERALTVLVSDHGEGLEEHGETSHGYFVYQSTLWVPLLVHWPAGAAHAARSDKPIGLVDVAPLILDHLHIAAPPSFVGSPSAADVYSESVYAHDAFGWAPLRALRSGDLKYIDAPHPELYNLRADPHELTNIVASNSVKAQELRNRLSTLLASRPPSPTAATQTPSGSRAVLGSLGYIASGPKTRLASTAADPKDRIADYRLYENALDAGYAGRTDAAMAALTRILSHDPKNTLARRDLGECYIEKQQYAKARESFQQTAAAAPDDYLSHLGLGIADEHLGLLPEALEQFQTACRIAPAATQCRQELEKLQRRVK